MTAFLSTIMSMVEGVILRPLLWLFPLKWVVVIPGEAAVRFTCGKPGPDLGTGVHFGTSTQTLIKAHVERCQLASDVVQTFTKDGVPLAVDVVITYRIDALGEFLTRSESSEVYLMDVAEAIVRASIQESEYKEFLAQSATQQDRLMKEMRKEAGPLGIRLRKIRLKNVEHVDPVTRASLASAGVARSLMETAKGLSEEFGVDLCTTLTTIRPSVQFTQPVSANETEVSLGTSE